MQPGRGLEWRKGGDIGHGHGALARAMGQSAWRLSDSRTPCVVCGARENLRVQLDMLPAKSKGEG